MAHYVTMDYRICLTSEVESRIAAPTQQPLGSSTKGRLNKPNSVHKEGEPKWILLVKLSDTNYIARKHSL